MFSQDFQSYFSKHRSYIMGMSMICIMIFHQSFLEGFVFKFFHCCGHWGVDMFLVVSGFGIAHSLTKNSRNEYYRHRVNRLLPACIVFGCIRFAVTLSRNGLDIRKRDFVLMPLSLTMWYIVAIVLFYLVAPYLLKPVQRWKWKVLLVAVPLCFLLSTFNLSVIHPVDWAIWRFPAFLSGMVLYCSAPWKVGRGYLVPASLLAAVLFLLAWSGVLVFNTDAYRYFILLFVIPVFCYIFGGLEWLTDKMRLSQPVKWIGKMSLHVYLSHELCYNIVQWHLGFITPPLQFVIALIISFLYAYVVYVITRRIVVWKRCPAG